MEFISVLAAAAGAYAFGAFWYMVNAKTWMEAAGIEMDEDGRPAGSGSPAPFILSAICMIVVAGMMRHMFAGSGIDTVGKGFTSGLGLGAFIALPWILTNYAYSMRPRMLSIIDGSYAVIGCTIMGIILALF
jgi:hypothetical protein